MVVSVHLLLEPSSSLVDAAREDLSLGLLRQHLTEILWLNERTRLQHAAATFKEFPAEGRQPRHHHACLATSNCASRTLYCMSFSYPASLLGIIICMEMQHYISSYFLCCAVHLHYGYRKGANRRKRRICPILPPFFPWNTMLVGG